MTDGSSRSGFTAGDVVQVVHGALEGYVGTVLRTTGESGLVVSIRLLRQSVAAEIDAVAVTAYEPASQPVVEQLRVAVRPVASELIHRAASDPALLYSLHPRAFEELVAELLRDAGYEVQLTPETRDGGRDILAVLNVPLGPLLTIVECKRFAASRRIGPELVQRLMWVADNHDRASHAILATTSTFTAGAREVEHQYRWRLSLHDFGSLQTWLSRYGNWKGSVWTPRLPP